MLIIMNKLFQKIISRYSNLRYILLIGLVFFIQACSLKYVYNQLDWIVVSYIEDFVTLDEEQSELLDKQIKKSFYWHRDTQLSLYSNWLQRFHHDVESGIDTNTVISHFDTLSTFITNILRRLADDIYVLLPTLTDEQINEILDQLSDTNDDFSDEFGDKNHQELVVLHQEKLVERYQEWIGDLSEQQINILNASAKKSDFVYGERYQVRLKWQKLLSEILFKAKAGKDVKQEFKNLFLENNRFKSKATIKRIKARKIVSTNLIVSISKTLSDDQKQHLFNKIDNYKSLFMELIPEKK